MKEKSFKFRESFGNAVKAMDDKQAGKFIKGLCNYVFDHRYFESSDVALKSTFTLVKCFLDTEQRDRENGKQGGKLSAEMRKRERGGMVLTVGVQEKTSPLDDMLKSVISMAEIELKNNGNQDGENDAKCKK